MANFITGAILFAPAESANPLKHKKALELLESISLCTLNGFDGRLRYLAGCRCEIWTPRAEGYHLLIHKLLTDGLNQIAKS